VCTPWSAFGPLLFVRKEPGTPYYGGPSHAQPTAEGSAVVTSADIARVRARQRELGVPKAFEWLAEAAPMLRGRIAPPPGRLAGALRIVSALAGLLWRACRGRTSFHKRSRTGTEPDARRLSTWH
jgi:hypothetical protein